MLKPHITKSAGSGTYKSELRRLQIELVKTHRHVIAHGQRVLVIFEGRDASGKDGTIKRIIEHLSPRETRVVALGKPSDREVGQWYFQRFVTHLPAAGEFVLFNRSWYNRAGVEPVMHFCTPAECREFLRAVVPFENMLVRAGVRILKYYLDISREEQRRRLRARARDPLTQWKSSSVDDAALAHWDDYSKARDRMLRATSTRLAPWTIVDADDKKRSRLNILRDLIARIDTGHKDRGVPAPENETLYAFRADRMQRLHR